MMKANLTRSIAIMLSRVVGAALTFAYTLLLTKVLAPEELGVVFFFISLAYLLSLGLSMNIESGSIRFLTLYSKSDDTNSASKFLTFCRTTVLATSALAFLTYCAFYLTGATGNYSLLYLITLAMASIIANSRINGRHSVALNVPMAGAIPANLVRPVFFFVAISLFWIFDLKAEITLIIVLYLISEFLTALIQYILVRPSLQQFNLERPSPSAEKKSTLIRTWISFGASMAPTVFFTDYYRNLVILLGGIFSSSEDVAVISVAFSFVSIVGFVTTAIDMSMGANIANATMNEKRKLQARLISQSSLLKLCALALCAFVCIYLLPYTLELMGGDYEGVYDVFFILLCIPLSNALLGNSILVLNVLGHRRHLFLGSLVGIVTLSIGVALGSFFGGVSGASLGAALGFLAGQLTFCFLCWKATGINGTILSNLTYNLQSLHVKKIP